MRKLSIVEYLALEENVPSGLRKILKDLYLTDFGRESLVEVNDDNTITCTVIKSRRYHSLTKLDNREIMTLKISTEDGKVISQTEEFVSKKIEDISLEQYPLTFRPKK